MSLRHERAAARRPFKFGVLCWLIVLAGTARCNQGAGPRPSQSHATLRVGIGGIPVLAPQSGLQQLVGNLALEGLVNFNEDGHSRPWLAESWATAPDGLSLTLQLRHQAKFHDGTPVSAPIVVQALQEKLPRFMGPAFDDVAQIIALDDFRLQIQLRRPSRFLIEALETSIQKTGKEGISTGALCACRSRGVV